MVTKGIRGAITVEANTKEALEEATLELLSEMFEKNEITGTSKNFAYNFHNNKRFECSFSCNFSKTSFWLG